MKFFTRWEIFAFGSAFFAGLTAVLGKMGVADINSNLATFIRTLVIVGVSALILFCKNEWQRPGYNRHQDMVFFDLLWNRDRFVVALLLPRASTWSRLKSRIDR